MQEQGNHRAQTPDRRSTVLFVDDETEITDTIRRILGRESFEVVTANRAQEALEILDSQAVDVIVSDEQMPEMAGSQLLGIIRDRHPDVMRIILTGGASMDTAIAAINEAEVFRFLEKPVNREELTETVAAALTARAAQTELRNSKSLVSTAELGLLEAGMRALGVEFQPLVSVATDETIGFETRVRARTPASEDSNRLLELAKRGRRRLELDERVFHAVTDSLLQARPHELFFIDIDPETLTSTQLYEYGSAILDASERVVLQMKDLAALDEIVGIHSRVERLRALGYSIAIGGLAAGCSGLASLSSLVPDYIKLDAELIRDIDRSSRKSKIARSLIALCRELRITSIAEGVETEAERDHLETIGCNLLQGHLVGAPRSSLVDDDSVPR